MSHPTEFELETLQFYSTAGYPCSYIKGREARSQVAAPSHIIDTATYSRLVAQGFRRSGLFTYRPNCSHCRACQPIRVDVMKFRPSRTQRKVWNRLSGMQVQQLPLLFDAEHFDLYQRYVSTRHPGAGMDEDSRAQYSQFLLSSRVDTALVEFRDGDGRLQMVSIIDQLIDGISAVYTFFEPQTPGSLGTFGILWQLAKCRELGLPWLYLGYWIPESRKMSYKSQYRPFQVLQRGNWVAS